MYGPLSFLECQGDILNSQSLESLDIHIFVGQCNQSILALILTLKSDCYMNKNSNSIF